jgi:alpha-glucosidase
VPNNWTSLFGGPAWQWNAERNQFYYHFFYQQQPDLNWRNLEVRKAMYDVMRFWMNRGVSGFRLDAVETLLEDPKLTDDPVLTGTNAYGDPNVQHVHTTNLPEIHEVFREMRQVTNQYPGGMLVGEVYYSTTSEMEQIYGHGDEINLPMATQVGFTDERSASAIGAKLAALMALPADDTPLLVFDNHDRPRSWDRYGQGLDDTQRVQMAKVIAATLLAPRGSALMYYGEEIGMKTTDPTRREDVKDPIGRLGWPKDKGRDGERTPMQWSAAKNGGFSTGEHTWLPMPPIYKNVNVAAEEKDPGSLLNFYKAMLHLRRESVVMRDGGFRSLNTEGRNVLAFLRVTPRAGAVLIALNFQSEPQTVAFHEVSSKAKVLLSTFAQVGEVEDLSQMTLPPFGVLIAKMQ